MVHAKNKGTRGEMEVIEKLQTMLLAWYKENGMARQCPKLSRNLTQSRDGGADVVGIKGLSIEVKYQEKRFSHMWWRQCRIAATTTGTEPQLWYRANLQSWRIRMYQLCTVGDKSIRIPVTLDLDAYEAWLRLWLGQCLKNGIDLRETSAPTVTRDQAKKLIDASIAAGTLDAYAAIQPGEPASPAVSALPWLGAGGQGVLASPALSEAVTRRYLTWTQTSESVSVSPPVQFKPQELKPWDMDVVL